MEPNEKELIVIEEAKDEEGACACACGGTMCGAQTIEFVSFMPMPGKKPAPIPTGS